MAKEPCTKLPVGSVIDRAGLSYRCLQEPIKPSVIFDKKFREHSGILSLSHQSFPIMAAFSVRPA
jgi:hypothetical protein